MKYFFSILLIAIALAHLQQQGLLFRDFESMSAKNAYETIKNNSASIVILDVRTAREIESDGYISSAIFIPVQQLRNDISKLQIHKGKTILVYCDRGRRSVIATRILQENGYKAVNIEGGIREWVYRGYDVAIAGGKTPPASL